MVDLSKLIETAAKELGYDHLKPEQERIIASFLKGEDVFGILPTGFGKSLCYACLPKIYDRMSTGLSVIVIITPLTAIIKDQVSFKFLFLHACMCNMYTCRFVL